MAARIRKGDRVVVTTGRDKGKKGEVLRLYPKEDRALVSGINIVKRHQRQTQRQQAGIVNKESPVHLSNLAHVEDTQFKVGDVVRIRECRPISKLKSWEVVGLAGKE